MRKWLDTDIEFIRQNCNTMTNKQFADKFNCSVGSIESIMRRYGIKRTILNTKPYKCKICGKPIGMTSRKKLCKQCYSKEYHKTGYYKLYYQAHAEEEKQRAKQWAIDNKNIRLEKQKVYREKININSNRIKILELNNYTCKECNKYFGKENSSHLVVHHKDRQGRNKIIKNNSLDNLECLCRSCHAKEHSNELQKARIKTDEDIV